MNRFVTILAITAACLLATASTAQEQSDGAGPREALILEVNGAIGPATRDFIVRAIEDAAARRAALLIIRIDTPGGLDASTRDIVRAILASPVPVVTWVAPSGARAASAGTYIMLASHIAAMAPATNVGAATPVDLIGGHSPGVGEPSTTEGNGPASTDENPQSASDEDGDAPATETTPGPADSDAMSRKVLNDSVAYIRGLASRHGRNADWAERAVREADSVTSEDALALNVIDLIAKNEDELLLGINGRTVELAEGTVVLDTEDIQLIERKPDWRSELLAVITDPTIAYILLLVGFYGLVLEGYHPGTIVPGVVGAISLLLALYALQMLPVNYAGLALIILGIILIIAETLAPSFGALGIGGIIALVIGSVILMDTDVPGFEVSRALIGAIALTSSALLLGVIAMAVRARKQPVVSGREHMLGERGTAAEAFETEGVVYLGGELWNAVSSAPLSSGQAVEVTAIDGLTLAVKPIEDRSH